MKRALVLARKALNFNETPIGAVLVCNNFEIGSGFNYVKFKNDPSSHAEINALKKGILNICNDKLFDSTLYVTMEPCLMCKGAVSLFKIKRVVFGAYNYSCKNKNKYKLIYSGGYLIKESSILLNKFFKDK